MLDNHELKTPCSICPAKCCRNYAVSLTANDMMRIAEVAELSKVVQAEDAGGHDSKLAPNFLISIEGKEIAHILRLRRDNRETCIFLGKNNLCQIYDNRPRKCRTYPFAKMNSKIEMKNGNRCPVKWKMTPQMNNDFNQDLEDQKKEIEEFRKVCKKWNTEFKGKRTLENFLKFILNDEQT